MSDNAKVGQRDLVFGAGEIRGLSSVSSYVSPSPQSCAGLIQGSSPKLKTFLGENPSILGIGENKIPDYRK